MAEGTNTRRLPETVWRPYKAVADAMLSAHRAMKSHWLAVGGDS